MLNICFTFIVVDVKEKSYNSLAVGLGTFLSLALAVVAVVFLAVLKKRHKRPSSFEGTRTYNVSIDIIDFILFMKNIVNRKLLTLEFCAVNFIKDMFQIIHQAINSLF